MTVDPSSIVTPNLTPRTMVIENNEAWWRKLLLPARLGVPLRELWLKRQIEIPLEQARIQRYKSHYEVFWPLQGNEASVIVHETSSEGLQLASLYPELRVEPDSFLRRMWRRIRPWDSLCFGFLVFMLACAFSFGSIVQLLPANFETAFCDLQCAQGMTQLTRVYTAYALVMTGVFLVSTLLYWWRGRVRRSWLVLNTMRREIIVLYSGLVFAFVGLKIATDFNFKLHFVILKEYSAGRDPIEYLRLTKETRRLPDQPQIKEKSVETKTPPVF